ncbi:hypothetical protein [Massilia sp. TS11]|uniref:hypothetical protein n=1 Tax=Massilia sp. TS11 TaxID=2908003 RepID=UPI001EDB1B3D|nr:hypothetical protein [Massilia sp. TS11]MCG2586508.1 hypothetical protein [Massilia sp. TS11]
MNTKQAEPPERSSGGEDVKRAQRLRRAMTGRRLRAADTRPADLKRAIAIFKDKTMAMQVVEIRVSFAWWVKPYLWGVQTMSALTGLKCDHDKVTYWLTKGMRIKWR